MKLKKIKLTLIGLLLLSSIVYAVTFYKTWVTFNGTTGYITVPDDAALDFGTGDFSICFWAKDNASGEFGTYLLSKIDTIGIQITVSGGLCFYDIVGGLDYKTAGSPIVSGQWTHFCFIFDRDGLARICKNGVYPAGGTNIATVNDDISTTTDFLISNKYNGSLDDLRIYKKALIPEEVAIIYNAGTPKQYSRLDAGAASAVWNIDEYTGTTITDEIGGLVGTFTGGVTWGRQQLQSGNYRGSVYRSLYSN